MKDERREEKTKRVDLYCMVLIKAKVSAKTIELNACGWTVCTILKSVVGKNKLTTKTFLD